MMTSSRTNTSQRIRETVKKSRPCWTKSMSISMTHRSSWGRKGPARKRRRQTWTSTSIICTIAHNVTSN